MPSPSPASRLEVRDLQVTYPGPTPVRALDGISLSVDPGECLGVLGESGSGKSTLARAALGLLPEAEVKGAIALDGRDLAVLDEKGWREVRWRRISLSFQSTAALNPVLRIGQQVAEPLRLHLDLGHEAADRRADELLADVGLGAWAAERYPRELSGGQRRLVLVVPRGSSSVYVARFQGSLRYRPQAQSSASSAVPTGVPAGRRESS